MLEKVACNECAIWIKGSQHVHLFQLRTQNLKKVRGLTTATLQDNTCGHQQGIINTDLLCGFLMDFDYFHES